MAKAQKSKSTSLKVKKLKWIPVVCEEPFRGATIGETTVPEEGTVVGKTIKANLMNITGDLKKQSISITFEIVEVKDNKALAKPIGLTVSPSSIKRFVRRGKDRIDDSFVISTKDGRKLRVKTFILTRNLTSNSIHTLLRKHALVMLVEKIKNTNLDDLIMGVVGNKIQMELKDSLKKIYPLKACDIRSIALETSRKAEEVKVEKLSELKPKKSKKDTKIEILSDEELAAQQAAVEQPAQEEQAVEAPQEEAPVEEPVSEEEKQE